MGVKFAALRHFWRLGEGLRKQESTTSRRERRPASQTGSLWLPSLPARGANPTAATTVLPPQHIRIPLCSQRLTGKPPSDRPYQHAHKQCPRAPLRQCPKLSPNVPQNPCPHPYPNIAAPLFPLSTFFLLLSSFLFLPPSFSSPPPPCDSPRPKRKMCPY